MINKENVLQTAQALVRQYDLPLKIKAVEEGREEVTIYFTSEKRPQLRELEQELEIQLNLPIRMERVKKSETGKIGGVDILGKYPCCAPFLRKCPFGKKFGCGYGLTKTQEHGNTRALKQENIKTQEHKNTKTLKHKDKEAQKTPKKEKKKVVRRLVLKG